MSGCDSYVDTATWNWEATHQGSAARETSSGWTEDPALSALRSSLGSKTNGSTAALSGLPRRKREVDKYPKHQGTAPPWRNSAPRDQMPRHERFLLLPCEGRGRNGHWCPPKSLGFFSFCKGLEECLIWLKHAGTRRSNKAACELYKQPRSCAAKSWTYYEVDKKGRGGESKAIFISQSPPGLIQSHVGLSQKEQWEYHKL